MRGHTERPIPKTLSSSVHVIATALLFFAVVAGRGHTANFDPPAWAYPETPRGFQPDPDDGSAKHLVGSTRSFTYRQLTDVFAPPDWYPGEHPRMPQVPVARGRTPGVPACSSCHLPNGLGRPESSSLAGLSVAYLTLQLADFKIGARHSSVGESAMADIARALTADEAAAAITYYAHLPRTPWITVVETDAVPKTRVVENGLRIPLEPEELEPIGQRIVEVPKYPARTRLSDSHAPFVAYVPKGSIRRGRAFVATGGAQMIGSRVVTPGTAVACLNCHGVTLHGMAHAPDSDVAVPGLAGRSPTYIVRQLYDVHSGARSAPSTALMKPIAAQLTLQQMIDIAAYLGSKAP
jgi:cytochrome c553